MALAVTAERVRAVAAQLAEDGLGFTGRQLYYAVCRDVEVPPVRMAPAELGLGAVLVLVGMIAGALTRQPLVMLILAGLGVVLVAAGLVSRVAERRPRAESRPLAVSFADFSLAHLGATTYPGMIVDAPPGDPVAAGALILCDRAETAGLLRAHRDRLGEPVLIDDVAALSELQQGVRCVVLHDASPGGCALLAELRDRGASVTDAGLNPVDVIGRRAQVVEGAPARLPRDLGGHLSPIEVDWLRSGRRVELATLSTTEILARVHEALVVHPVTPEGSTD